MTHLYTTEHNKHRNLVIEKWLSGDIQLETINCHLEIARGKKNK